MVKQPQIAIELVFGIVVVPEPSVWAMAMAGTGLLLALQHLRRRRT